MTPDLYTANMTETQRNIFYAEYERTRKDELAAILFAFFLGSFGAHHFYLKRNGLGILYAFFFWTGIPGLVAIVECFFMPGRVRTYNALLAVGLSNAILSGAYSPAYGTEPVVIPAVQVCATCGAEMNGGANFCIRCGTKAA